MMTNSTSQEKVVFLAKAMISANDAVDNLRDKVKIQSTLWTILFLIGCVTFDLTKSEEIIHEKFFVFLDPIIFQFQARFEHFIGRQFFIVHFLVC